MVKERKKAKAGKSMVFKKKDGSSVSFKASYTRSKQPAAAAATSKKRSKPNPPAEAP